MQDQAAALAPTKFSLIEKNAALAAFFFEYEVDLLIEQILIRQ